jgi:prepilin-type N-terminal cleavage/methylation domain-containing protein
MASGNRGFTIIELMVTVAVVIVLMLIAQPSFEGLRQRAAVRGAGEHLASFWNQARLEAAKRNGLVKVGVVQSGGGSTFCLGAATTTDPTDTVPCDCTVEAPASDVCDIARFPNDQSEWRNVTLTGITLGGGTDLTDIEATVIEPKRTNLVVPGDAGTISISGPSGQFDYRINLAVDRFGKAQLCESTSAADHLSDYATRQCAP